MHILSVRLLEGSPDGKCCPPCVPTYATAAAQWCVCVVQVDSPPDASVAQEQQQVSAPTLAPPSAQGYTADLASVDAGSGMLMDFPANGTQPRRQLLLKPPRQLAEAVKRRMLPELYNATWGLDILDQGQLPLDNVYRYTYNGVQPVNSSYLHATERDCTRPAHLHQATRLLGWRRLCVRLGDLGAA